MSLLPINVAAEQRDGNVEHVQPLDFQMWMSLTETFTRMKLDRVVNPRTAAVASVIGLPLAASVATFRFVGPTFFAANAQVVLPLEQLGGVELNRRYDYFLEQCQWRGRWLEGDRRESQGARSRYG